MLLGTSAFASGLMFNSPEMEPPLMEIAVPVSTSE